MRGQKVCTHVNISPLTKVTAQIITAATAQKAISLKKETNAVAYHSVI
jgi:hypothetical protein